MGVRSRPSRRLNRRSASSREAGAVKSSWYVLAAARGDPGPRTPVRMGRSERARDRKETGVEVERDPARSGDVPRVLRQTVTHVDARRRHADQRRPQGKPGNRPALPIDRHARETRSSSEPPRLPTSRPLEQAEPQPRVTQRP